MAIASNFPSIKPSLLLDFANVGRLDPRITFTRASTGTYYDGVTTAVAEQNLLLQSQDLTTSPWTVTSLNAVGSKTAPDGTATAIEITATATNGRTRQTVTVVSGQTYTHSMFVRRVTGSGNVTLAILDSGGTALFSTVMSLTSDWQRFTVSGAPAVTSIQAGIIIATSTDAVEVWGAQLEQRSAVTAYTATTTQAITNYIPVLLTAQANVARFDHNPTTGEALGLLIEEQRTNLVTYSEDFADAAWTKTDSSITSNTIVAPDGTLTGDKLVENTANATHSVATGSISFTSGTSYTLSVYAKAAERTVFSIIRSGTGGASARFDLSTLTATNLVGTSALSITAVGNGWYRCVMSWSAGATASRTHAITLENPSGTDTYTGNGYSGIFIWGAQLEAGSFATSYIPTTTTALTRNADAANMTGTNFSSWYNDSAGTIYVEGATLNSGGCFFSIEQGTGSISNSILLAGISSSMSFRVRGPASATQALITLTGTYADNVSRKYSCAYEADSFNAAINGSIAGADDTSGTPPSPQDNLKLGYNASAGTNINGTIRRIAYYTTRLTDAQLQALTG
jgi:hypothetical protein